MSFDNYFDPQGLLVNRSLPNGGDAGDTAQMTGLYRFGQYIKFQKDAEQLGRAKGRFAQECDMLTYVEKITDKDGKIVRTVSHPGTFVRHPGPCYPLWATNPRCFSRDQQRSLVVAMGALKQRSHLWATFKNHVKRWGWYQNDQKIEGGGKLADFAAPDIWGEYIRAFAMSGIWGARILYPVLLLTDLSATVGLLSCFFKWRNPDEADDDNLILTTMQAKMCMPTPISWLNRKIYKRFRPKGPQWAMSHKHRAETGSPPFAELWNPILDKEL